MRTFLIARLRLLFREQAISLGIEGKGSGIFSCQGRGNFTPRVMILPSNISWRLEALELLRQDRKPFALCGFAQAAI